jgi:hypothetical protein
VALRALDSSDFEDSSTSFPQPYSDYAALDPTTSSSFHLPSVLVPPEIIELDGLSTDAGEDAQVKREEWPEYFLRLFDTGVRIPYSYATTLMCFVHRLRPIRQYYLATQCALRC